MSREIHIASMGKLAIYVLMEEGHVEDCFVTTQKGALDVGAIYMAKADRIIKGSGGMFVAIGDMKAFLRTKASIAPGKVLPVQVVQYASHDKPMRVSEQVDFRGQFAVLTPARPGIHQSRRVREEILSEAQKAELAQIVTEDCGIVLRSEAEFADYDQIKADVEELNAQYVKSREAKTIGLLFPALTGEKRALAEWGFGSVSMHDDRFPDYVRDALAEALMHPIQLPSGGKIFIEQTRALIAVDVNTGENTKPNAAREVNREAVYAIAKWIKLMGWGGQLVVDFAPMPGSAQKPLAESFAKAARNAGLGFTPRGFGPIGLMEGTIKFERLPIQPRMIDDI